MKALKQEDLQELTEKVLDLIAKTSVEIGHKTDPQTMASLSKVFAQDAFHHGVRFGKDEPFLNIRTFYKWTYEMKGMCDNAYYEVKTLGKAPKTVPYYQEPVKLLS